jgi:hypothetical protein
LAKWKPGDPVVFVEGVHYPVGKDGHPDLTQPLRADAENGYRPAEDGDPLHNEGATVVELQIGGE